MRSGTYAIRINAGRIVEETTLKLDGHEANAHGETCDIRGQISHAGRHLIGSVTVELAPALMRNRFIGAMFVVAMTGVGSEEAFELYGLGPLGLIVEIVGTWIGL